MTLKELHFFYALSTNPQVTQVAQKLQVSQSAISLAIKSLENKLNEPLFDRIGKKLILNERGRLFKEKTYTHYMALKDAQNAFNSKKLAGSLNIAASITVSNYIMPNIYFEFLEQYEDVKFNIDAQNSSSIIQNVVNGNLDLGLIETSMTHPQIIKEHLCDDELIIVTSDCSYSKECFIDTIDKKWILREVGSGTREIFTTVLKENIDFVNVFMELHSFEEIKSILLKHKNTITAISKTAVEKELKEKKLFEVKLKNIEFKREFSLIYHKNKTENHLMKTLIDFIKNAFENLQK